MNKDQLNNAIYFMEVIDPWLKRWDNFKRFLSGARQLMNSDKAKNRLIAYYWYHKQTRRAGHYPTTYRPEQYDFLKNPPPYVIKNEIYHSPTSHQTYFQILTQAGFHPAHSSAVRIMEVTGDSYMIFDNEADYQTALNTIQLMKD